MTKAKKSKAGVGLLLILLSGCNAARWRSAGLDGGIEIATYFGVSVILFLTGLWLIFRKTGSPT